MQNQIRFQFEVVTIKKILMIDQKKCRSCRTCEVACSFFKYAQCDPARSRIHAERWDDGPLVGTSLARVCQQCTPPSCIAACPTGAITLNKKTGALQLKQDLCTKCGLCINDCTFGAIIRNPESGFPLVCDLCGGKPKCEEWCPAKAISYVPITWANLMKKRELSADMLSTVRKAARDAEK